MIASEQNARTAIVIRDMCRMMSGDREHVDHAITKIDAAGVVRPVSDPESLLRAVDCRGYKRDVRHSREALVAFDVVAVTVRMRHHKFDGASLLSLQPFRDQLPGELCGVAFARAGVNQKRALLPENQVKERFLIVSATRFAKNIEGRIVFVHLPGGHLQTVWTAGPPRFGQAAGFEILGMTHDDEE